MSTNFAELIRPTPAPAEPSNLTNRAAALFAKIRSSIQSANESKAITYAGIAEQLIEAELDPSKKLPTPDSVQKACDAAGQSLVALQALVADRVKAARLAEEIESDRDVADELAAVKLQIEEHQANHERMIAESQATGDRLLAKRRDLEAQVRELNLKQSELATLDGGPSPQEIELTNEIGELQREEMRVRSMAGRTLLSDRYVDGSLEDSKAFKQHAELAAEIERLEASDNAGRSQGYGAAAFKLRKLSAQVADLEREIAQDRPKYKLGAQVREIRRKLSEVTARRAQVRADRLAMLGK